MRTRSFGWSVIALSALAASGCSTTPSPQIEASGPPEPEIPAHVRPTEIVGRWGYAAYHKPEDRARTEANARGQCKQPYVIGQGTNGGVMMYLADSSQLQELRLKGSSTGKDYIGPAGRTPGKDDREILLLYGKLEFAAGLEDFIPLWCVTDFRLDVEQAFAHLHVRRVGMRGNQIQLHRHLPGHPQ